MVVFIIAIAVSVTGVLLSRHDNDRSATDGNFHQNSTNDDSSITFCLPAAKYHVCMNATCMGSPDCECNAHAEDTLNGVLIGNCVFCDVTGYHRWKIDCTNLEGEEYIESSVRDKLFAGPTLPSIMLSSSSMPTSSHLPLRLCTHTLYNDGNTHRCRRGGKY